MTYFTAMQKILVAHENLEIDNKRLREALEEIQTASYETGFYKVSSIEKVIKIVNKALLDVRGDTKNG